MESGRPARREHGAQRRSARSRCSSQVTSQDRGSAWNLGNFLAGTSFIFLNKMSRSSLARKSHQLPAADADPCAVTGRTPSSRFDVVSATPSPARTRSFGPCGLSQRRLAALATKAGEISGLAMKLHHVGRGRCHVICPLSHQRTPLVEQVRAGIGAYHRVADRVGKAQLHDCMRRVRLLARLDPKRRTEAVHGRALGKHRLTEVPFYEILLIVSNGFSCGTSGKLREPQMVPRPGFEPGT